MPSLAKTLAMTHPVSPLLRKARRFGVSDVNDMLDLAATRGCRHYSVNDMEEFPAVSSVELSDLELTVLLLLGENTYNPTAIRCAAQLARSPRVDPLRLARLAIMEKCERVLAHIARAGIVHDSEGAIFWKDLLEILPAPPVRPEPHLPHWSRFVSMPGIQRSGVTSTRWLVPQP